MAETPICLHHFQKARPIRQLLKQVALPQHYLSFCALFDIAIICVFPVRVDESFAVLNADFIVRLSETHFPSFFYLQVCLAVKMRKGKRTGVT